MNLITPSAVSRRSLLASFNSNRSVSLSSSSSSSSSLASVLSTVLNAEHMRPANPFSCSQGGSERLISLIKSCAHESHLLQIHAHILRTRSLEDPTISLRFLSRVSFSPFGHVSYARRFFSQIKNPSLAEFNTMIRAYSGSDSPEEGLYLYRKMRRLGERTNLLPSSFCIKLRKALARQPSPNASQGEGGHCLRPAMARKGRGEEQEEEEKGKG